MNNGMILSYSRSYLAHLLPVLGKNDDTSTYIYVVQNLSEKAVVERLGGRVVLVIDEVVKQTLKKAGAQPWNEPEDFRKLTNFDWSPVLSDRYLINIVEKDRAIIAKAIFDAIQKLFEEHNIAAVLSEPVALYPTQVLLYFAKKTQVKPLFWLCSFIPGFFYFSEQINPATPSCSEKREEDKELIKLVSEFVEGVRKNKKGPVYHHAFSGKQKRELLNTSQRQGRASKVLQPSITSIIFQVLRLSYAWYARFTYRLTGNYMYAGATFEHKNYLRFLLAGKKSYDVLPKENSEKNVMYPLQYEPEASLLYSAPHVFDQKNTVELILRSLPDDKVLWVKEHPNQFGALSTKKWRRLKTKYSNLKFIYGRDSGRDLIKASSLVITISSTAGMDGLIMGKRVLVLGSCFYQGFHGAIKVLSTIELAKLLNDPGTYKSAALDGQKVTEDLYRFIQKCYRGDPQPSHYLYSSENIDSLISAINKQLGRL